MTKVTALAISCFIVAGCNTILDNNRAQLGGVDEANEPNEPAPSDTSRSSSSPPTNNDTPQQVQDGRCKQSQMMCFGACVDRSDPTFGCGQESCTACKTAHATAACKGGACGVQKCDPGYADCNGDPSDGCETDLSKAKSCGSCNAVCGAAAPFCSPAGAGFQCSTGCAPLAPTLCGLECVDTRSSLNHCGGCNNPCRAPDNGTAACTAGVCAFTCKPQFHACGGRCMPETDPSACGASCTPCPVPANGVATCTAGACGTTCNPGFQLCAGRCVPQNDPAACGAACTVCPTPANGVAACTAGACGITCSPGFADCDKNPANGCEVDLGRDPLHCGACGKTCNGTACTAGACEPAAADGGL